MIRVLALAAPFLLVSVACAQDFSAPSPFYNPLAREITPKFPFAESDTPDLRASLPVLAPRGLEKTGLRPPNSFFQKPSEVEPYLFALAKARPERVKLWEIGQSALGKKIWGLEIRPDAKTPSAKLKRLFVICRQHGNEPEATASGTRFLAQFLNPATQKAKNLARKTALFIVPIANPDGAQVYQRRNGKNVDMNRDWGRNHAPEVKALTQMVRLWKPNLVVDNHQWLPDETQPPPMAEASGPALSKETAHGMSQSNARRGYALAARSRWGLDTLCHRFWGQRFRLPAVLLETRHRPSVAGAREKAINQALTSLWSAVETVAR